MSKGESTVAAGCQWSVQEVEVLFSGEGSALHTTHEITQSPGLGSLTDQDDSDRGL